MDYLWQYQCMREGTLFYYVHGLRPCHLIQRCPVCGSKRLRLTRRFPGINETDGAAESFDDPPGPETVSVRALRR